MANNTKLLIDNVPDSTKNRNRGELLLSKTPYDALSPWQKDIIMNQYNAAGRSGPKSLEREGIRIQRMYPGFRIPL